MIKENWNLNNYQMQARKFAVYPERARMTYPALGLAGEAGEVADKVSVFIVGITQMDGTTPASRQRLQKRSGMSCGIALTSRKTWDTHFSRLLK